MRRALWNAGAAVFACTLAFGQAAESLTFEVASVKPSAPIRQGDRVYFGPPRGGPGTPGPGQITWSYATLKALLTAAYDTKAYQVSGPAWLDTERYDIAVKVPAGATKEQVNAMWQNLLAERFGLKLHHESTEFPVEELVVAKGGPKLKETTEDLTAPLPPGPPQLKNSELSGPGMVTTISPRGSNIARARTIAKAQPLSKLTELLGNQIRRPVLDKTGLTGKYDFNLEFTLDLFGLPLAPPGQPGPGPGVAAPSDRAGDSASEPGPTLADAVQQLGLRLVASRANLDVLVIDKAEKVPTEN
jgi:uncharacterized protein (TIGR03435 family)